MSFKHELTSRLKQRMLKLHGIVTGNVHNMTRVQNCTRFIFLVHISRLYTLNVLSRMIQVFISLF